MKTNAKDLWTFRRAAHVSQTRKTVLLALVAGGIYSQFLFMDWWFRADHVGYWGLYLALSLIFWYGMVRMVLVWVNYLRIERPDPVPAPAGLRVAIFTTSSPGEPLSMFEKTLEACARVSYPHTTYLLDDTRDPAFAECARRHGAVHLELVGIPGAKAGKINAALKLTEEEFILVLDPDHIPFPNFLDHTLGFFADPKLGFVQVCQAYYNQYRSFTAAAAAEQTYTFYGPTQMGMHGFGCAVAIGANCTFRRAALESIGGHGIGLAEDLITSIRIHAAGWTSIYNPVVVSRGLVPEDFGSFCKQQLKWARGVFEVTFHDLPRLWYKLTGWQRLSYLTIGTYYLVGFTQFFFTFIPFLFFATGILPAQMSFVDFLLKGAPVVFFGVSIYLFVQRWMCHPATERGLHWRGTVLKFACWPVFLMGFLLSIINADIPYIPTAKKAVVGYFTPFARPLVAQAIAFLVAVASVILHRRYVMDTDALVFTYEKVWGMMAFAFLAFLMATGGILAALEANRITVEEPWAEIDLDRIHIAPEPKPHVFERMQRVLMTRLALTR